MNENVINSEEGVIVGKVKKKKERIRLNESLNNQLDSMEDTSSLDVFTPKKDNNLVFMDMVNEANDKLEKDNGGEKESKGSGGLIAGIVVLLLILFFFFMFVIIK